MGAEAGPLSKLSTTGVAAAAAAAILAVQAYRRWRSEPRNVSYQWRIWPFGHLHLVAKGLDKCRQHDEITKAFEELQTETYYLDIPLQPPIILTVDPKNIEHILKGNFDNYPKGNLFGPRFNDLLGDGIFNADGALWHSQRKTSSKMFTANKFKNHIWKVVDKNSAKVVQLLRSTRQGEVVDMFSVLNRFTLDSIGEIGFGADVGSLEHANSPFLASFDRAQQICMLRFVIPGWPIFRLLGLGTEWGTRRHVGALRDYARTIVRDLKGTLEHEAGDSFVGLFMKSGEEHSDKLLEDLVLNFLIAGRDTTAQAMGWCLWEIMQHSCVEEKILEEAAKVMGGQAMTYDMINKLEYLDAVIRESLRLHPSVPLDGKEAAADDTLPNGTWVARGSTVAWSTYAMGRNRRIWGEDAAVFRPERWFAFDTPPDAYTYMVFHAGPRECLGKRLAMVEMKALLLLIVKEVKLTLAVPPEEVRPDFQLTIGMSTGLPCHARPRSAP